MYQTTIMNYYGTPSTTDAFPSSQRYAIIDLEAERREKKAEKQYRAMLENQKMQKLETRLKKHLEEQFAQMINSKPTENLDNLNNADITGISKGETNDMPIERRRVIIGKHDNGEPIYKHLQADTRDEMNDKIVEAYIASGRINEFMPKQSPASVAEKHNFKEFAEQWLSERKDDGHSKNTTSSDQSILRVHLLPYFQDMNLEDIDRKHVVEWLKHEKANGTCRRPARLYIDKLRLIIKAAIRDNIISKDPTEGVKNPCEGQKKRITLTEDQVVTLFDSIPTLKHDEDKLLLYVLMFSAVRIGEALGLRWEDFDFRRCELLIERSEKDLEDSKIGSTKTKNSRTLTPDEVFFELLKPFRKESGFLFPSPRDPNKPLTYSAYKRRKKRIEEQINLYGAHAHVFRRTLITIMNQHGVSLTDIQAFAGHKSYRTTLQSYIEPTKAGLKKAGGVMGTILNNYSDSTENIQSSDSLCTQICTQNDMQKTA